MKYAVYAFALLGAHLAFAQVAAPLEGEYVINDGAWGRLQVQGSGQFKIVTTGANGHQCQLDGVIVKGRSKLANSACHVDFKAEGANVNVTTNGSDDCKSVCGARAWFNGLYLKPPPLCEQKGIAGVRKKFKAEYGAKNYSDALATLSPVATQCKQFLYWIDSGWILNDLALTQFKLGDRAGCLRTLQGLAPDAAKSDEEITGNFPPADSDLYLRVIGATRTNLKLCMK
jgi:hypothetical protein